jgi:hypothetical protein
MRSPIYITGAVSGFIAIGAGDLSMLNHFAAGDHGHPTGGTITALSTDTGSAAPPMKAYVVCDPHHVQVDRLPTQIANLILK